MQFSHDTYQLEKCSWHEYFDFLGSKMNDQQDLISPNHHDWQIRKNYLQCCDVDEGS